MSFGSQLKRERELRGVFLEEISEATKISVRMLEAIESDRFDILPDGIFRKSFIKSYATYIGMDADKTLQEYALATGVASASSAEDRLQQERHSSSPRNARPMIALVLTLGILLIGLTLWYFGAGNNTSNSNSQIKPLAGSGKKEPEASTISPETAPSSLPAVHSQNSTGVDSTAPQASSQSIISLAAGKPELKVLGELARKPQPSPGTESTSSETLINTTLSLKIEALDLSWISVGAGETTLFTGLMHPGEARIFSLEKPLRITLGNAGGVSLLVNDNPLIPIGKSGEVRILELTAENYKEHIKP